ncbi:uncharacterized protein LOC132721597 [Ruditapes philippinarum]|uniref:uncharacterized protein LOC132721597 n=1 Tax=Ruditapes philippinarum TaxID=129788 RepID=UPI00295BDDDA|nr:uncharacterized protein LOC132721597 [Ruditapes philippinarum]
MANSNSTIPVIDFDNIGVHRKSKSIGKNEIKHVGNLMKEAFTDVGFCYLKNHGIEQDMVDIYMDISREFFEQPEEEKIKHVREKDQNYGWVGVETEKLNPARPGDWKEAFNFHPAFDPNDWPSVTFQQASRDMFLKCTELSYRVLDVLSVGLGLGDDFMRNAHKDIGTKDNPTTLRSVYYPPIPSNLDIKSGQIRLGEHTDWGTITLLFQDDIGGLEVEIPGKGFVPVTPIPGTIVVNTGDLMQRWTADKLLATRHRVVFPNKEEKKKKSRQSAVFFVDPHNEYIVECLDGSKKYEPISILEYLAYKFSLTY